MIPPIPSSAPSSSTSSLEYKVHNDLPISRSDYRNVRFWLQRDWKLRSSKPWEPEDTNITLRYVEDEHGVMINGLHASDMRKYAQKIWAQFRDAGKDPPTWGKADSDTISSYRRSMRYRFPELALCESDWKSDKLATANYSNWYSTPVVEKTSNNMTRRCSDSATRVSKKARVETAPPLSNTTDFPTIPVSQHTSAAGDSNVFPDPTSVFPLSGSTSTFTTQANHEARLQFNTAHWLSRVTLWWLRMQPLTLGTS